MFLLLIIYINYLKISKMDIKKDKFESSFFNMIYLISYSFPINIFVKDGRELNKKERETEEKIEKLNLLYMFDLRTFMALKFLLLFISIIMFFVIMLSIKYLKGDSFKILKHINYLIIVFVIPYIPDFYLKKKEKDYEKFYYDESVILQLFMILFIKSGSTIENIIFAFSKMNTYYKKAFQKAYRMSLRNKSEALSYLENKFENTSFGNSFNVLNNMHKYSKEGSIRILKANLKTIRKESMNKTRKKELTKFSYSQISLVIPFLITVFLGAIPFIQYGISMITEALQGM